MRLAIAAAALLTLSCAPVPQIDQAGPCRLEGLADLVGRPATEGLGSEALRRSGARRLRWIRPGDMVTMDYSAERLNVHLDSGGRVERFDCG
jgi:Peptidase inhibitor I78 family